MIECLICKIASLEEMNIKWEYEIAQSGKDKATAMLHPKVVQNSAGLVGDHTVFLSAFRTIDKFQGKGYFSELFHFMIDDLRHKGFTKATLGVEPADKKNKDIYIHYGFNEYIKSGKEYYPDGTVIDVEYYGKTPE